MKALTRMIQDEKGMALPLALCALLVLSATALAYLAMSAAEPLIARNHVDGNRALYIAEAGLERTKQELKMFTGRSLNGFLSGTTPGPYLFGNAPVAGNSLDGGNYLVRIYNNNPSDPGGANNDTDNRVFVESTGLLQGARRRVVVLMTVPLVPDPAGALEMIAPTGQTQAQLQGGARIDGADWNAPADMSTCVNIAGCGTLAPSQPAIAGIATSNSANQVQSQAPSGVDGNPPVLVDGALSASSWESLANALIPKATRTVGNSTISGTVTWGTASAPEITVISGSEVTNAGTINGAGVLIVNTGATLISNGDLNWQGVVIIRGGGQLQAQVQSGQLRVFGVIAMETPSAGQIQFQVQNATSFVKYSRSAVALARQVLGITVSNWQEVANF